MTGAVRRYTAASPAPEDWWAGPEAAPDPHVITDYDERDGVMALEALSTALHTMADATNETDMTVADAVRYMAERLDVEAMAGTVALVQDLRRRLGLIESYVSREAGTVAVELDLQRKGALPDGRVWELRRGARRTLWDHEDWKRDVRAKITDQVLDETVGTSWLTNAETGELVDLAPVIQVALDRGQAAHSSNPPKVTALKALDLDPKDYCEQAPGLWSFSVVAPADETTTNDSGEPND